MERYLVYDAGCSVCTQLAELVRTAAPAKLSAISINDDAARHLLDQAYPHGWIRAPYLVVVRGEQVRAWTGLGAAARLAALMGPRKAWQVWREARRAGVTVPPGTPALIVSMASRRHLLKIGAAVAGVAGMAGLQQQLSPATVGAQPAPCQFPTCDYQYFTCDGYCQSMPTRADWRTNWYFCYDGPYYCGWDGRNDGCRCYR